MSEFELVFNFNLINETRTAIHTYKADFLDT